MKEKLYTIPVTDAFHLNTECPLCILRRDLEERYIESLMNSGYMEPECRIRTNRLGFCARHNEMLCSMQNKLGIALMTHTHLQEILAELEAACTGDEKEPFRLFKKTDRPQPARILRKRLSTCMLCDEIEETLTRYLQTILYLYETDPSFQSDYRNSKGFCLPHFADLLESAEKKMIGQKKARFIQETSELEIRQLKRTESDLSWFIQKYDYRNQDKPWGTSRGAAQRAVRKLRGGFSRDDTDD